MKMFGIAALAVALAAAIAIGGSGRESTAQEETPELGDLFAVNPSVCLALTAPALICNDSYGNDFSNLGDLNSYRQGALDENLDGEVTREEVNRFNRGGNHLHDLDGKLVMVAFVDDDEPLVWDTDDGAFQVTPSIISSTYVCDQPPPGNNVISDARADEDCDGDGVIGDGLVFAQLIGNGDDRGESMMTVFESTTGEIIGDFFFLIVGEGDVLSGAGFETVLGAGLPADDCTLPTDVPGFTEALGNPHKTVVIARVADSDDLDIIGTWVHWETDDPDIAIVGAPDTPTLDLGTFGIGAPQVICGLEPGTATLTLTTVVGPAGGLALDPQVQLEETELEFEILDVPDAVTLTATPASVNCDGVASTEVAATVTTADGEFAANGTIVHWSVQVLGIATPLTSTVTDGVAKTTVTPLAVSDTGVPVIATTARGADEIFLPVGSDGVDNNDSSGVDEPGETGDPVVHVPNPDVIQSSILVTCGAGSGAPPPPPPGDGGAAPPPTGGGVPGTGTIGPPDTGSGGDIDGRAALPVWPAIALFAGAMALVGARWGLRNVR